MFATDLIRGTEIDDVILAVVGLLAAVTTIAALSHKPPLRQVGQFIGWVFGRLVGEPVAGWFGKLFENQGRPIIRQEVEAALADEHGPVQKKLEHLHGCVERMGTEAASQAAEAAAAAKQAVEAADATREWREGPLAEWQAGVDVALSNVQNAQAPHIDESLRSAYLVSDD